MWKISLSAGSIYEHKNVYGRRKKVHQINDDARLSWKAIVKTKSVGVKRKLQTADCRLQTGGKMQTEDKMQTADCRPGVKCRLRVKCRLQTADQG